MKTIDNDKIIKKWQDSGIFSFDNNEVNAKNVFSVDTPPPTVSGTLHMGHIFSYCHCDFIARFQRLNGANVFYPIGFDDNGLPTEKLVEKKKKIKAVSMVRNGQREEFLNICKQVIDEDEEKFEELFKSVGFSFDWTKKYQTIKPKVQKIAQISFTDLFLKGLVYISNAPVYWDATDQTALAQAEIEEKEIKSVASDILFTIHDGNVSQIINLKTEEPAPIATATIMTTRPELLPACICLLYHQDDERYNGKGTGKNFKIKMVDGTEQTMSGFNFSKKYAKTPFGLSVPILTHSDVSITKGTGLVMCCSFGDWQDTIWIKDLNLTDNTKIIISDHGRIANFHYEQEQQLSNNNEETAKKKSTLSILSQENSKNVVEARQWALQQLSEKTININGQTIPYLVKSTKITHNVKCGERSGKPLEILHKPQWYIDFGFGEKKTNRSYFINTIKTDSNDKNNQYKDQKLPTFKKISLKADKNNNVANENKEINQFQDYMLKMSDAINIFPASMQIKLTQWIKGLGYDWCISRNRFAGIPIPKIEYFVSIDKGEVIMLPTEAPEGTAAYQVIKENLIGKQQNKIVNLQELLKKEATEQNLTVKEYINQSLNGNIEQGKWLIKVNKSFTDAGMVNIKEAIQLINNSNSANLVFDTWFTSSISPQINTGKIACNQVILKAFDVDQNKLHTLLHPFDIRPQAHEIIRTWTFYTMAKSYLHAIQWNKTKEEWEIATSYFNNNTNTDNDNIHNVLPWKNIVLSGWCLASDKTKMSKSKGNIVDPVNLIKTHGADAIRYWSSTAHLGVDTPYAESNIKEGVRLVKKIINVAKFIQTYSYAQNNTNTTNLEVMDKWILLELEDVITKYTEYFLQFDYCRAREVIEEFFWKNFCDNYIEIIKGRIYGETSFAYKEKCQNINLQYNNTQITQLQQSAIYTAKTTLNAILTLLAPFVPFVTESVYLEQNNLTNDKNASVHTRGNLTKVRELIKAAVKNTNPNIKQSGQKLIEILNKIRKDKSAKSVSIKTQITHLTVPQIPNGCEFDLRCVCNAITATVDTKQNNAIDCITVQYASKTC
ncbi:MAG: class I tRNA ligase family protein [Alphaproteobacteria bacterium]|nr:class I tRNA ligase family protein [Rickettsiales bacterium]